MDTKRLITEAGNVIEDPDIIIDVYDMTFVWVSDKILKISGMKKEDFINKQVFEYDRRKRLDIKKLQFTMLSKLSLTHTVPVKTKNERLLKIKLKAYNVSIDGNPYIVEKIKKVIG